MDIKMPRLDGVAAVKRIRKVDPDIKFIMVSAYDTFEYAREVMREGVKEYLLKPSKKEDIIASVGRVIREIRRETNQQKDHIHHLRGRRQPCSSHVLIQEAECFIQERCHESITLEDVAKHIDFSIYHFSKLFKEETGQTFVDYITDVRLERSKYLLTTTDLTLKEICFDIGYHNPNYFSRVFKKHMSESASQYRIRMTKK